MSTSRTQAYIWDIPAQTPCIRTQSHLKHNNKTKHLPPLSLIINFATRTPHPNPFPSSFFLARLYRNRLPISSLPFMSRRLNTTHLAVPNIQPHFHKAVLSTSPPFHPQPRSSRHHSHVSHVLIRIPKPPLRFLDRTSSSSPRLPSQSRHSSVQLLSFYVPPSLSLGHFRPGT